MNRIPLTQGKFTIVDEEDYDELMKFSWRFLNRGYAVTSMKSIGMHRMLLGAKKGEEVDHINGDKLDNRRENLRLCTHEQNCHNRVGKPKGRKSKYKGVHKYSIREDCFQVMIQSKYIGIFLGEEASANAYNYHAKIAYGEFARLNDVPYMDKEEWMKYKVTK